jgi:hypothetical protein
MSHAGRLACDLFGNMEPITVLISALKVTAVIQPDQLPLIGETDKAVELTLDLGDGQLFVVPFSGKTYRRSLRSIAELQETGDEVVVLLQGRLIAGRRIEGAGLSVQSKTPKST